MANSKIGIILADGEFYPIMDDDRSAKKRLVVSTVRDKQKSVQINVYRREDEGIDKSYVGSLFIENIPLMPSGEPDIRLDIGLDDDGNLHAAAREEKSGKSQALDVSLRSLSEDEMSQGSDFSLDTEELESEPLSFGLPGEEESLLSESTDSTDLDFEIPEMETGLPGEEVPTLHEAEDLSPPEAEDYSIPEVEDFAGEPTPLEVPVMDDDTTDFDLPEFDETSPETDDSDDFSPTTIPDAGSPEEDAAFASFAGTSGFDPVDAEEEDEDEVEPTGSLLAKAREAGKGGRNPLLIAVIAVIGTAAILACAFLVYKCTGREPAPAVTAIQTPLPEKTAPLPEIKSEPVPEPAKTEPVAAVAPEPAKTEPIPPVAETPKPEVKPVAAAPAAPKAGAAKKPGVWYKIKWGDTLWDLSYVYYRNPWLYPRIASANKIKDADHIVSGKWIFIPPK